MMRGPKPITAAELWGEITDPAMMAALREHYVCVDGKVFAKADVPQCAACGVHTFDLYAFDGPDVCADCDTARPAVVALPFLSDTRWTVAAIDAAAVHDFNDES